MSIFLYKYDVYENEIDTSTNSITNPESLPSMGIEYKSLDEVVGNLSESCVNDFTKYLMKNLHPQQKRTNDLESVIKTCADKLCEFKKYVDVIKNNKFIDTFYLPDEKIKDYDVFYAPFYNKKEIKYIVKANLERKRWSGSWFGFDEDLMYLMGVSGLSKKYTDYKNIPIFITNESVLGDNTNLYYNEFILFYYVFILFNLYGVKDEIIDYYLHKIIPAHISIFKVYSDKIDSLGFHIDWENGVSYGNINFWCKNDYYAMSIFDENNLEITDEISLGTFFEKEGGIRVDLLEENDNLYTSLKIDGNEILKLKITEKLNNKDGNFYVCLNNNLSGDEKTGFELIKIKYLQRDNLTENTYYNDEVFLPFALITSEEKDIDLTNYEGIYVDYWRVIDDYKDIQEQLWWRTYDNANETWSNWVKINKRNEFIDKSLIKDKIQFLYLTTKNTIFKHFYIKYKEA